MVAKYALKPLMVANEKNIDISIQQKTNLSGNFEGQTTKNYLRLNLLGYLIFWEGCLISFKELL